MSFYRCGDRRLVWLLALRLAALPPHCRPSTSARTRSSTRLRLPGAEDRALRHLLLPGEEAAARTQAARMAERWYTRLSPHPRPRASGSASRSSSTPAHPISSRPTPSAASIGEGTGGVTEALQAPHRAAHRRDAGRDGPRARPRAGARLPVRHDRQRAAAQHRQRCPARFSSRCGSSRGWRSTSRSGPSTRTPRCGCATPSATRPRTRFRHRQLDNPRYFPYRYGQALWAYVAGRWGDEAIGQLLRRAGRRREHRCGAHPRRSYGIRPRELSKQWHAAIHAPYRPLIGRRRRPADLRARWSSPRRTTGALNVVAGAQSRRQPLVFLSERDLFSIELFLADARTGQIKRQAHEDGGRSALPEPAVHQLRGQLVDPPARRFVFGAVSSGTAVLRPRTTSSGGNVPRDPRSPSSTRSSTPAARRTAGRSCSRPWSAA